MSGVLTIAEGFSYFVIGNSRSKLGQTQYGVVGGLQVGELLAQEVLQPGHIEQGEVVRRCERLGSGKSQAEQEAREQPCGHGAGDSVTSRVGRRRAYTSPPRRGHENTCS